MGALTPITDMLDPLVNYLTVGASSCALAESSGFSSAATERGPVERDG